MTAARYVIGLVCLFVISCAAIVLGYYNDILGFRISVELAFEHLPILASATFMTLACPVTHVIAFRKYPDDYENFSILGLPVSFFLPLFLMIFVLPDESELSVPLFENHLYAMYVVLWVSFYGTYHLLHRDFWRFARREL